MNMPGKPEVQQIARRSTSDLALTAPGIVVPVISALVMGALLGTRSTSIGFLVLGMLALAVILALRQDIFTASLIIAMSLLEDWYRLFTLPVTFPVASLAIALCVLAIIFFGQSQEHPWVRVHYLWLWALLVVVASLHILQGVSLNESVKYVAQIFIGGAIMWVLGTQIVRTTSDLHKLLVLLTVFGTLIAIHSILFSTTDIFLLETPDAFAHLAAVQDFRITGTSIHRAGSFIGSPDWNGTMLAMLAFIPLGLLLSTSVRWKQVMYGVAFALMVVALLMTYSTAAWAALGAGIVAFILLGVHGRTRIYVVLGLTVLPLLIGVLFQREVRVLIGHMTASGQLSLRMGAWKTAIAIILSHPLTGIGLGGTTYLERAAPYRDKAQIIPLAHPHNAYLELAASAGLPLLIIFATLLILVGRRIWRTYEHAQRKDRVLVASAIAALIALTFNSVAINGWTLPPLAAIGWLLAGALSSPALVASLRAGTHVVKQEASELPAMSKDALRENEFGR